MSDDRREHQRVVHPFEGTWSGASGATRCRIGDISMGGCYVQSLATPTKGETTTVSVQFGNDHSISLTGTVVYSETGMGFALRFNPLSPNDRERLKQFLEALRHDA